MGTLSAGTSEIVESAEELDSELKMNDIAGRHRLLKPGQNYSIEDDINQLFEAIDIRCSGRVSGTSHQVSKDAFRKSAMKRPIRVSSPQSSGIGISESVSLKQALRGLCISQASEMAAMKRLSKPAGLSGSSEAGTIKRLYRAVVVDASESGLPFNEGKGNLVEISLVPEKSTSSFYEKVPESLQKSKAELEQNGKRKPVHSLLSVDAGERLPKLEKIVPTLNEVASKTSTLDKGQKVFRSKNFVKKKVKLDSALASTPAGSNPLSSSVVDSDASKPGFGSNCSNRTRGVTKGDERSRSSEKGEFSQSSKSSIGQYSSSTSISEESNVSGSSRSGNRPHMSKDLRWEAIHHVQKQHETFGLRNFKLLKRLGCGDIGTVYLVELTGTNCLFALKVMDNEFLATRKKMPRAQTEREILQMLDHPFLPTLYAHFTTDKLSCLVMEYCPGGDLHVLRQKQPSRSFSEQAARFYAAEVLLALEYLHMLGVVYRDLKPENILVREDGHIMLSDFDLSLRCAVNPMLLKSASPVLKSDLATQVTPLPQLVAEPTSARSNSFVGTHEYLAPEIIKGEGHGSAVDWWTFGIFLYELLYGKTPFKGSGNEDTLASVVSHSLKFPESPMVSFHARDLIRGLLVKEPENRLGSVKGATEIKQHSFFEGLNWALIRCAIPPEMPKLCDAGTGSTCVEFELF
ncbi:unnamed protein product, partial [Vitis vinifera]